MSLGFKTPKISYSGKINEVTIGKASTLTVGGESSYPFHLFEGQMPNPPKIAMEIWDTQPDDWPITAMEPFADGLADPAAWAKKCVEEFGAEAIVIQLKSTDPNGLDKGPEEASAVVRKVLKAIKVPIIVWGSANENKDTDVLRKISADCEGENLTLGPVSEGNFRQIGASALGYHHTLIASTPIDVNLAKQLNILLENLGIPKEKIIIDPTTGGLGYGLEYSYSVMERIRMAALAQEDEKLQYPIINNLGNEIWKSKEANLTQAEAPTLGDAAKRGILMEAVGAVSYLLAGSDILILRHPETAKLVKRLMAQLISGDLDMGPLDLKAKLAALNVKPKGDYPEITKKKAAAVQPRKEEKKAAPPQAKETAPKAEAERNAKAEEKAMSEIEAKKKVKAEAEAKIEAEKKPRDEAKAKAKAEEEALQAARSAERAKRVVRKEAVCNEEPKEMKVAEIQLSPVDKLLAKINRVNRRK